MTRTVRLAALGLALASALVPAGAGAGESAPAWRLDAERSVLSVVTRKAGVASKLAHDHLVAARVVDASWSFDPTRPEATSATVELAGESLVVDDDELRRRLESRLIELGLLDEPFAALKEKDRRKIRREMLDASQLDAARHPTIRGRLVGIDAGATSLDARVELEVRGERQIVPLSVQLAEVGGGIRIEAWGATRFSEFGIEPYSAFFGAVRNRDELAVYLELLVAPAE